MRKIIYTRYEVDTLGNVYGINCQKLKPATDSKGYLRAGLMINDKLCTKKVHRLVAEAFIPNPENKPCVNHIDGVKDNNTVNNLEWVTYKENTKHAIDNGLFSFQTSEKSVNKIPKSGSLNGNALLTESQVLEIRYKYKPRIYTRAMLALEYKVKESCIKDVVNRNSWKHI
jgi:HNH endonuclease.